MSAQNQFYDPTFIDFDNRVELLKAFEGKKERELKKKDPADLSTIPGYEGAMIEMMWKEVFKKIRTNGSKRGIINKPQRVAWGADKAYVPRGVNSCRRLRLSKDITCGNEAIPIPVFCDLDQESHDHMFSFDYAYSRKNSFLLEADERKYIRFSVSCKCQGSCKKGSCACVNLHVAVNGDRVKYMEDGRVRIENPVTDMYSYMLVMCGLLCGCPLDCPNRFENSMDKNQFELFRRNAYMGFGVRTMNSLSPGELVMEFNGTVHPGEEINDEVRRVDYAMEVYQKEPFLYLAGKMQRALRQFPAAMFDFQEETAFIDPYRQGNVARFISFGCKPNLQPLRIIANIIHPRHHHIGFYALGHVTAGSELFFNYGSDYRARHDFNCQCETALCQDSVRGAKKWLQISDNEVQKGIMSLHESWRKLSLAKDSEFEKCLLKKKQRNDDDDILELDAQGDELPQSWASLFDIPGTKEAPRAEVLQKEDEAILEMNKANIQNMIEDIGVQAYFAEQAKKYEERKKRWTDEANVFNDQPRSQDDELPRTKPTVVKRQPETSTEEDAPTAKRPAGTEDASENIQPDRSPSQPSPPSIGEKDPDIQFLND